LAQVRPIERVSIESLSPQSVFPLFRRKPITTDETADKLIDLLETVTVILNGISDVELQCFF
jgi:hypothetical protein